MAQRVERYGHTLIIRVDVRRRHRVARRMKAAGAAEHEIASALGMTRRRVECALIENEIWGGLDLAAMFDGALGQVTGAPH